MDRYSEERVDDPEPDSDQSEGECVISKEKNTRGSKPGTPTKKRKIRNELTKEEKKQPSVKIFQASWMNEEEFKGWLKPIEGDATNAKCVPCNAVFNAGKSEVRKHASGKKYEANVKGIRSVRPVNEAFLGTNPETIKAKELSNKVKTAEIQLSAFFAEHSIAISTSDHLIKLLKVVFTDPDIARNITLDRTKCTAIMKSVLAKTEKEELIKDLQATQFSVLVYESTDKSNEKNMCLLTKYVSPQNGQVMTSLLEIISLDPRDCSAEAMYGRFKETLSGYNIPIKNVIGLACDHAPVMVGVKNSFASRLKEECPWLILLDCVCHSSHIAANKACGCLPSYVVGTIRKMLTYTSGSPKRCAILEDFQDYFQAEQKKLIRVSLTRWLVMHPCVVRILDNLVALERYFLYCSNEDKKDKEASELLDGLRNPYFKAYLLFLKYVLEYFNQMNALFQSEKVLVHQLQASSERLLQQVCQNFMRANELKNVTNINVAHPHFQLPLENVYLGPGVEEALSTIPFSNDPSKGDTERGASRAANIKSFRLKCLEFYIIAAKQLQLYLPLNSQILKEAEFISPTKALSGEARQDHLRDLPTLRRDFKDVVGIDSDQLSREWRNMPYSIPAEQHDKLSKMEPPEFWEEIRKLKDFQEKLMFPNVAKLARVVMSFPHSNAATERIFSIVTDTETNKRNRMGCETLDAICVTRSAMRQRGCPCYEYKVTKDHLLKHNNSMYADGSSKK